MDKIGKHEEMKLISSFVLNGKITNVETGDDTDTTIGIENEVYGKTFEGEEVLINTAGFPFSKQMEETMGWREKYASIRMFTDDKPIDPTKVEEEFIINYYGGAKATYSMRYSDLTGYLWTDEGFVVGGHDILEILKSNYGKYVHMEIELYEKKK